jgi:hypothetical protein
MSSENHHPVECESFLRLPDSIQIHVGRFLGLASKIQLVSTCQHIRKLLTPYLRYYQDIGNGALPEMIGRRFSLLLDIFRYAPIALNLHKLSREAQRIGVDMNSMHLFRVLKLSFPSWPSSIPKCTRIG